MQLFVSILAFLIIFSVVVLIHEFGHFIMARRAGIKVEEFGMGLPPRLFGIRRRGVLWSINAIPFGGFVKMLGEDTSDKKALTSKDSFINKTIWQRIKVVIAGVVMNILLAFVLLTIGFIFGMEPLIVTSEDFLQNLRNGNVVYEPGYAVKDVEPGSIAEKAGLQAQDRIVYMEAMSPDGAVLDSDMNTLQKNFQGQLKLWIERNGQIVSMPNEMTVKQGESLGLIPYPALMLPAVQVKDIATGSPADHAGIKRGDIIAKVNGERVFEVSDFEAAVEASSYELVMEIVRNNQKLVLRSYLKWPYRALVTSVVPNSAAAAAGILPQDQIVKINGGDIFLPQDAKMRTGFLKGQEATYTVFRDGVYKDLKLKISEEGLIGVVLAQVNFFDNHDLSLYEQGLLVSILEVKDVTYPFYQAPFEVFGEVKRLSYLTATMFLDVLKKVVGEARVPEGVSGPVGIARMTYTFVEEGFTSLLRFTALISLSLGVINILPLPALDGGRLAFLVVEGIMGRPLNQKWEARIHFFGFIFLILLILAVTINDIGKIFN